MIAWGWMVAALFGGVFMGWMICALMVAAKGNPAEAVPVIPTPESVYNWFAYMNETEMSKILYPMVKRLYLGRRTIHRCPQRRGETFNLFDKGGE